MSTLVDPAFKKLGGVILRLANVVCKKLTFVNIVQEENAFAPIAVTDDGIETEVRPEQLKNAFSPIVMSPSGNVTEVRFEQLWNAPTPHVATDDGIIMEVRPVHPLNAV